MIGITLKAGSIRKRFLLLAIVFCFATAAKAQDTSLTVIGNPKGTPSELKMKELKSILKGERQRWSDGTKIVIALMKTNTPAGEMTCKKIYNMSGDELKKFWLALVFQGKAQAPDFFNSTSDLAAFIAQTPGAIGVVAPDGEVSNKVITIDGNTAF